MLHADHADSCPAARPHGRDASLATQALIVASSVGALAALASTFIRPSGSGELTPLTAVGLIFMFVFLAMAMVSAWRDGRVDAALRASCDGDCR